MVDDEQVSYPEPREWDMADSVPVRCPDCRREHLYTPPAFPCPCGAPVVPPLAPGAALPVTHRTWEDAWVTVRCHTCGRHDRWPHPELGCDCGAVLHLPVRSAAHEQGPGAEQGAAHPADPDGPERSVLPPAPVPRPVFQPVTIRTARDAATAGALYLRWLGYRDIRRIERRATSAVGLTAPGVVAEVEPSTRLVTLRDVECLWLNGLTAPAVSVYFALAGYTDEAMTGADRLRLPLFVLDLTGTPQPVNSPADELITAGA